MKNVDYKPGQIVAAGVLAGAYPKSHKWDADRCLTHAARVTDGWPEPLCTKVKRQMSVSDDSTQFNLKPVDCPACLAKLRKLGLPVPGQLPDDRAEEESEDTAQRLVPTYSEQAATMCGHPGHAYGGRDCPACNELPVCAHGVRLGEPCEACRI